MLTDKAYLYVEDDAMSRDALKLVFTRLMNVTTLTIFEDSQDFMERVCALPRVPDVFLLDIHMTPHSGIEMLNMLRKSADFKDATVIALTASVMNEEVTLLKESGFNGAIGKPIDVEQMPSLVERIIAGESVWHVTN